MLIIKLQTSFLTGTTERLLGAQDKLRDSNIDNINFFSSLGFYLGLGVAGVIFGVVNIALAPFACLEELSHKFEKEVFLDTFSMSFFLSMSIIAFNLMTILVSLYYLTNRLFATSNNQELPQIMDASNNALDEMVDEMSQKRAFL